MDRIALLEDALAQRPHDRFALYALALERRKLGEDGEAEALLRRLLVVHPESAAGALQLSRLLESAGREEEAVDVLRTALDSQGDDAEARRARGELEAALLGLGVDL